MSNKKSNTKSNAIAIFLNENTENIFRISCFVEFVSAILFCFFTISFHADISLLAFPISACFTAVTIYTGFFKILRHDDAKLSNVFLRLVQYMPYVFLLAFIFRRAGETATYKWYDGISVFLWCIIFIFSFVINHYMNPKKFEDLTKKWAVPYQKSVKKQGIKYVIIELLEWIDALVQAVFFVFLVQVFFFQLYVIPSESMVPEFLIGDKVIVTKCNCGPKFPLTDIGFPIFTDYKRGDVVVLRNPKYTIDRKSELQSVKAHLIYMLSCTTVNLNVDENGNMKYDPLVKRICGEQGEQLVMLDGTLYARTKDNPEFTAQKIDSKYALWDLKSILTKLSPGQSVRTDVIALPYDKMLKIEQERRALNLDDVEKEIKQLLNETKKKSDLTNEVFPEPDSNSYSIYRAFDLIASDILTTKDGFEWFTDFALSWTANKNQSRDMYQEANYRLNVMYKYEMTKLIHEYSKLIGKGFSYSDVIVHPDVVSLKADFENLNNYILQNDQRNMPVFPACKANGEPDYIPENCYFMMGDNRFNSEDLRHSGNYKIVPITDSDPKAIKYYSNMDPMYINKKLIEGKPIFKFWPLNRAGKIRNR